MPFLEFPKMISTKDGQKIVNSQEEQDAAQAESPVQEAVAVADDDQPKGKGKK